MTRLTLVIAILALSSGCSTLERDLENVVTCVAGRQEAHALSKWKYFSIGAKLAADQGKTLCVNKTIQ